MGRFGIALDGKPRPESSLAFEFRLRPRPRFGVCLGVDRDGEPQRGAFAAAFQCWRRTRADRHRSLAVAPYLEWVVFPRLAMVSSLLVTFTGGYWLFERTLLNYRDTWPF